MRTINYAIRHIKTGEFMPQLKGKGYSHWNPDSKEKLSYKKLTGCIRLFETKKRAMNAVSQWNSNPNAYYSGRQDYFGDDDWGIEIKDDGRKKEDLEIVEVCIKVKGPKDVYWTDLGNKL